MKNIMNYFYLTYLATTLDGRQCTGGINIEVNRSMFNRYKATEDIIIACGKNVPVKENSVVILNWIKFDSKAEYELFQEENYEIHR